MDSQPSQSAPADAGREPPRSLPKILLVDDEPVVLRVTASILHRSSFAVTQARSGEEALDKLQGGAFDLVVTDFRMEGKNGADVVIAARKVSPATPVVLMTGRIDDVPDWMRSGSLALPIVQKPFVMDELLRVVIRAMGAGGEKSPAG